MLKKEENLEAQWEDRMIEHDGDKIIIWPSFDYPRTIIRADLAMRALVASRQVLFKAKPGRWQSLVEIHPIAKAVQACANIDYWTIQKFYEKHRLSPYFELLAEEFKSYCADVITGNELDIVAANKWVEKVRQAAGTAEFARLINTQERGARKNARAVVLYLRELHERYARLCVIRVDLAYSAAFRMQLGEEIDPSTIKRHLSIFLRKVRAAYPALVGYVWKLEFGERKSFHVHLMAIFNGHEVRQDATIAQALGELWSEVVTAGAGGYWNCNAKKEFYERRRGVGIGMIEYDDLDKRKRLENAALYLAKSDYYVRLTSPAVGRTFAKGQLAEMLPRKLGRPRQRVA